MSKPIIDKAEVSIDFPDKFYHGSFGHESHYDVKVDDQGVHIALDRDGDQKRKVAFHIHPYLFAGILESVAEEVARSKDMSALDRQRLADASAKLAEAASQTAD